jgi:hypothetical protein
VVPQGPHPPPPVDDINMQDATATGRPSTTSSSHAPHGARPLPCPPSGR